MELLNNNYTLTISGINLLLISAAIFAVIGGLLLYSIHLSRQVKEYQRPKFGFLGKPLYPLLTVVVLGSSLFYLNFQFSEQKVIEIQASKNVEAEISAEIISGSDNTTVNLAFSAIPEVEDTPWGNSEDSFDLIWKIKGVETIEMIELSRSASKPSGFTKALPRGSYNIQLVVLYQDKSYEFHKEVTF